MKSEVFAWLEDILQSIDEIFEFLPEKRNFFEFEKDVKTKKAIERNIEIIGEAINRIIKIEPEITISNSRKIVDTRNRIIHGYDKISSDIIWLIATKSLPLLKKEVQTLLRNR